MMPGVRERATVANAEIETVPVSMLSTHPENPRIGDMRAIGESVAAHGFYGVLVAQRSTGRVLAGNHRLVAARAAGITELPVAWLDVDDDEARRILLADNRATDLATYDDDALADLLASLESTEVGLEGTLYVDDDAAEPALVFVEMEPEPLVLGHFLLSYPLELHGAVAEALSGLDARVIVRSSVTGERDE
jgi:hypothetical protein